MSRTLKSTPRRDGFRMPAEFEPHAGTWMIWPERPDNWRLGAWPAQEAFVAVAAAIAASEPVTVGASARQYPHARQRLPATVRVVEMSSNDAWARDTGPTGVVDARGRVRGVDWVFNAWGGLDGGLYFPWDQDDLVAGKVLEVERLDRYRAPACSTPTAIPGWTARTSRPGCATTSASSRSSGWGRACSTTRPTGTWTTSAASCGPARWR